MMRRRAGTAILALVLVQMSVVLCSLTADEIEAERSGWKTDPETQYHVQTDDGPERYFRFQTLNGQYRKEKRLQDGTVVGTEGWLDPLGYLRIKDYIADAKGFRILKSKMIFVGKNRPIQDAVSLSKSDPASGGELARPHRPANPFRRPELKDVSSNSIESSSATPLRKTTYVPSTPASFRLRPIVVTTPRPIAYTKDDPVNKAQKYQRGSYRPALLVEPPYLDQDQNHLASQTTNRVRAAPSAFRGHMRYNGTGFQYYLKKQYHEEERQGPERSLGSFGYVDPFGIRRVVYYRADARDGFVHRKNNRYVGHNAKPYDPQPVAARHKID
ncbi:uncharacterized protein LOC106640379 [Copidosoma floridanum]|uniref:uncharacterized protein LOC106640379 n=1 Tax=Copidosoma floridanum TaxID=29053 RepID=UPI0006C95134|nr:uncharacterized protein LOC106640379 [Copidosoma floridanum]